MYFTVTPLPALWRRHLGPSAPRRTAGLESTAARGKISISAGPPELLGRRRHPQDGGLGEVAADDHEPDRQRPGRLARHRDGRVAGHVERRRVLHHLERPAHELLPG